MISALVFAALPLLVSADMRIANAPDGAIPFREPDTFCYAALEAQKKNANDNFVRSNIDNQQNTRNVNNEPAIDMLPCRSQTPSKIFNVQRGQTVNVPIRWNNPHVASCEVNIWSNAATKVATIKNPFPCGGGYQDQVYTYTIPQDLTGCTSAADGCFIQIYGHSVEPRTYAVCTDVVVGGGVAAGNGTANGTGNAVKAATGKNTVFDVNATVWRDAIHYSDAYHFTYVDSQYSPYQGQNWDKVRQEVKDSITVRSYQADGGLVGKNGGGAAVNNKAAVNQVKTKAAALVAAAEKAAIAKNKAAAAQVKAKGAGDGANTKADGSNCFEGETFGVAAKNTQCTRQYTNTYVTNVPYDQIAQQVSQIAATAGVKAWEPTGVVKKNGTAASIRTSAAGGAGGAAKGGNKVAGAGNAGAGAGAGNAGAGAGAGNAGAAKAGNGGGNGGNGNAGNGGNGNAGNGGNGNAGNGGATTKAACQARLASLISATKATTPAAANGGNGGGKKGGAGAGAGGAGAGAGAGGAGAGAGAGGAGAGGAKGGAGAGGAKGGAGNAGNNGDADTGAAGAGKAAGKAAGAGAKGGKRRR